VESPGCFPVALQPLKAGGASGGLRKVESASSLICRAGSAELLRTPLIASLDPLWVGFQDCIVKQHLGLGRDHRAWIIL
jgi:hypothetical protein